MAKMAKKRNYHLDVIHHKPLDFRLLKRLLSYLKPERYWLAAAVFMLLLAKLVDVSFPLFIGYLTQKFFSNVKDLTVEKEILQEIMKGGLFLLGLLFIGAIFETINTFIKSWIGERAIVRIRSQTYGHIIKLPASYFSHVPVGRLMTRTIHDVDQIEQMFTESVVPLAGSLILFFTMWVAIFLIDKQLTLVFLAMMPFVYLLAIFFRKNQRRCFNQLRAIIAAMNSFVNEHLQGVMTIQIFGLQKQEEERFDELNEDYKNGYLETVDYFSILVSGIDFLQSLTLILLFLVLSLNSTQSGFQAGVYFAASMYVFMFYRPLIDLSERYNILQSAMAGAERIFLVLDEKTEELHEPSSKELTAIDTIEFRDVWFAYQEENWVLKGTNLRIDKGETIALVGITGAGKTTIASLLLRFYDIQKGSILINGEDIRTYSLHSLRNQFSLVLQDPVIFSGSLYENIALYEPAISEKQVEEAIDYVNFNSFVNTLPQGIHSGLKERGKTLSVGEMQLVSLARAVAHKRSMLILDEATANIDTGTEKVIQQALEKILKERMAIVIAHRLSTIKDVNRILVFYGGVVAEEGTFQDLLQKGGIFEKLYRLQFSGV